MSDYLKNLQESNKTIHGFIRQTTQEGPKPLVENGIESDDKSDDEEHECEEGYKWCPKKKACVSMEDMEKDKK